MSFDEVRLPENVEKGAQGGPRFKTTVLSLSSGFEKRNIDWSQSRGEWDVSYGIDSLADLQSVISFFYARRGRARGFRFKDWSDFRVERQLLGVGDGVQTEWQLFKRYQDTGGGTYDRILKKIVLDTTQVWVNSAEEVGFSVDITTGLLTFNTAPANGHIIEFACEFDVPVRFDSDKLDINLETFAAGSLPSIPILELRVA